VITMIAKRSKFFFFLFLFLFPLTSISSAQGYITSPNALVFESNLDFQLSAPGVQIEIGGKKLINAVSMASTLQEDGYRLYHNKMFFEVEANIYSIYSAMDVFPDAINREYDLKWLDLYTSNDPDWPTWNPWTHTSYSVQYNSWDLGTLQARGLDGPISVEAEFTDLSPAILDFGDIQIEADTKSFIGQIGQIDVTSVVFNEIGNYDTYYQGDNVATLTALDLSKDADPDGDYGVANQISNFELGVTRGPQTTPTFPNGQQGQKYIQQGVVQNNQFYGKIIPNVIEYQEMLKGNYQYLVVDVSTAIGGLDPAGIDTEFTKPKVEISVPRTIGWEVTNYNAHLTLQCAVDVYALSAIYYNSAGETDLADLPAYQLEDIFFNNLIYGETSVVVPIDPSDPLANWLDSLWENYWPIIMIAGIGAIFVFLGPYVLPIAQAQIMKSIRKKENDF